MTSLLDKRSQPAGKSEVELFSLPPTQVAIERGYWHEVFLKNSLTDSGPFEFHIPADPSYIDLSKNYIFLELSILKKDGTKAEAGKVGPINLVGKTIFKQVKLYLNNKVCMDSGDGYAFISYLQTELNYGPDAKATHLETALYERDKSESMDSAENDGWKYRAGVFENSRRVQMMAPIHCDLFNQERLLLSHMDIRLELHRNSDAFALLAWDKEQYKIKLHKMSWFVKKVDLAPSLALSFETYLSRETAKYPIRRMVCKTINIDATSRDTPNLILTNGQIPRRVILTFIEKSCYFGDFEKNPFNFKPYNVREITITAGGYNFPRNPIELDFDNKRYIHGYVNLMEALNLSQSDRGNSLTLSEFAQGYFFYAIDLTPDTCDGMFWELVQQGTVSVKVVFRSDLKQDIKMLCFCEFDNLLSIDKNRNVFLDYST